MIAWNGKEEILLLTTDLKASEPTRVLEVIPLPSEPLVKKGDTSIELLALTTRLLGTFLGKEASLWVALQLER